MSNRTEWRDIPGYPGYIVSNEGHIVNARQDRPLRPSVNQQGISHVALYDQGFQKRKSVAVLVAKAFLGDPPNRNYTTPIHLDGNKENNRADNLMWRPRWFAIEYHKQFDGGVDETWLRMPCTVVKTGEEFDRAIDCAVKYGLLVRELVLASMNPGKVVPILWSEIR